MVSSVPSSMFSSVPSSFKLWSTLKVLFIAACGSVFPTILTDVFRRLLLFSLGLVLIVWFDFSFVSAPSSCYLYLALLWWFVASLYLLRVPFLLLQSFNLCPIITQFGWYLGMFSHSIATKKSKCHLFTNFFFPEMHSNSPHRPWPLHKHCTQSLGSLEEFSEVYSASGDVEQVYRLPILDRKVVDSDPGLRVNLSLHEPIEVQLPPSHPQHPRLEVDGAHLKMRLWSSIVLKKTWKNFLPMGINLSPGKIKSLVWRSTVIGIASPFWMKTLTITLYWFSKTPFLYSPSYI